MKVVEKKDQKKENVKELGAEVTKDQIEKENH